MVKGEDFPDLLMEVKIGTYYISPLFSLKVDSDFRTLWLDLETSYNYFKTEDTKDEAYNYPIMRKSFDTKRDFVIFYSLKFNEVFNFFKKTQISILDMIQIILNPQIIAQNDPNAFQYISQLTSNFSDEDRKELIKFEKFIKTVRKEKLTKLLIEPRYSLLFGNLDNNEEVENHVATQPNIELKKQKFSLEDVRDCFGEMILSDKTFVEVFESVGLQNILADTPIPPKGGGAIFIDMGGTGKSLMKGALQKVWKKLGGACIEKNGIAEFTGDVNYATLIQSWYFGYDKGDSNKYDKEGLFNLAIKNKVPSLLIVDEADRFVKSSSKNYKDEGADLIINEFKKYLNDRNKGKFGVLGYVVTVFIANVDEAELNPQLKQGGERLYPVYFGPPNNERDWLDLIEMYVLNYSLIFSNRSKKFDLCLAKLILFHNQKMSNEKFMIVPRKFGPNFCGKYLALFNVESENITTPTNSKDRISRIYSLLHSKKKETVVKINYNDFIFNFIHEYLLKEVRLAGLNVEDSKNEYINFVNKELNENIETNSHIKNSNSNEELKRYYDTFYMLGNLYFNGNLEDKFLNDFINFLNQFFKFLNNNVNDENLIDLITNFLKLIDSELIKNNSSKEFKLLKDNLLVIFKKLDSFDKFVNLSK